MTVGRFQPFTQGHLNMINEGDAPCIVYRMEDKPMEVKKNGSIKFGSKTYTKDTVKKAVEYIDNPTGDLSEQEKELLKRPFTNELIAKELDIVKKSNKNIVDVVPVVNMFDALDRFNKFIVDNQDKYEPQYWMCGDDRVDNYSEMIGKYDELETYLNSGEKIQNVLKDVLTTNTGKGRTEGISGTAVRQALFNKDKEAFKKVMPKGTEKMFDDFIKAIDDFKNKIKSTIKESRINAYMINNVKPLKEYIHENSNQFFSEEEKGKIMQDMWDKDGEFYKFVDDKIDKNAPYCGAINNYLDQCADDDRCAAELASYIEKVIGRNNFSIEQVKRFVKTEDLKG